MFSLLLLCVMLFTVGARMMCICNINHPRLPIMQCPYQNSKVIGFIDQNDANSMIKGVVVTESPFCEPHLEYVTTPAGWAAVLTHGNVGFVSVDVGEMKVPCNATLTPTEHSLNMSHVCHASTNTKPSHTHTMAHSTPVRIHATTIHPTPRTTTPSTPHLIALTATPAPSFIACRKIDTILHVQKHEPIIHQLSRTCTTGESESEGVIYELCQTSAPLVQWKKGKKVKDHCHDNSIPTFTAVASFFHDKPIDAAIFVGCNPTLDIQVFQQKCGTIFELKMINGYEADDYYTIVL